MKLLIASPLFPPDTAASALYVKELAAHLQQHEVTLLLYGHLPEHVQGATFVCVDKRKQPLHRIIQFTTNLITKSKQADYVLLQNGPSVELPTLVASFFTRTPLILCLSDTPAHNRTKVGWMSNRIHQLLQKRSLAVLDPTQIFWPPQKPTIHPLRELPETALQAYESAWLKHIEVIESYIK